MDKEEQAQKEVQPQTATQQVLRDSFHNNNNNKKGRFATMKKKIALISIPAKKSTARAEAPTIAKKQRTAAPAPPPSADDSNSTNNNNNNNKKKLKSTATSTGSTTDSTTTTTVSLSSSSFFVSSTKNSLREQTSCSGSNNDNNNTATANNNNNAVIIQGAPTVTSSGVRRPNSNSSSTTNATATASESLKLLLPVKQENRLLQKGGEGGGENGQQKNQQKNQKKKKNQPNDDLSKWLASCKLPNGMTTTTPETFYQYLVKHGTTMDIIVPASKTMAIGAKLKMVRQVEQHDDEGEGGGGGELLQWLILWQPPDMTCHVTNLIQAFGHARAVAVISHKTLTEFSLAFEKCKKEQVDFLFQVSCFNDMTTNSGGSSEQLQQQQHVNDDAQEGNGLAAFELQQQQQSNLDNSTGGTLEQQQQVQAQVLRQEQQDHSAAASAVERQLVVADDDDDVLLVAPHLGLQVAPIPSIPQQQQQMDEEVVDNNNNINEQEADEIEGRLLPGSAHHHASPTNDARGAANDSALRLSNSDSATRSSFIRAHQSAQETASDSPNAEDDQGTDAISSNAAGRNPPILQLRTRSRTTAAVNPLPPELSTSNEEEQPEHPPPAKRRKVRGETESYSEQTHRKTKCLHCDQYFFLPRMHNGLVLDFPLHPNTDEINQTTRWPEALLKIVREKRNVRTRRTHYEKCHKKDIPEAQWPYWIQYVNNVCKRR